MGGLRFHAMLALTSDCILVHGGRNFKAKPSDNVNGYIYACLIVDGRSNWYNVPFLEVFVPRFLVSVFSGHAVQLTPLWL